MERPNEPVHPEIREGELSPEGPDCKDMRLLLVDDCRENRQRIESYLYDEPYQIDAAENGQIAVGLLAANRYNLVLKDIQMPVMDGHSAMRAMRNWERQ